MSDEMGSIRIVRFREMDFIPLPEQIPLRAVARLSESETV
jgi:hypothetical protein